MLSLHAQKLLAWFGIYKITPTEYNYNLSYKYPKAQRRGVFASALAELVTYESNYGYFNF